MYAVLLVASAAFLVAVFLLPIRPWWSVAAAVDAVVLVPLVVAVVRLFLARLVSGLGALRSASPQRAARALALICVMTSVLASA